MIMKKILVIGDVMLDIFSYGDVRRLNPEAPAPLLNITHEEYKLWWSANVAANIASLQGHVDMIGIIGQDTYGTTFQELCKNHHIDTHFIFGNYPTITKQRFIENTYEQQLLRVDYEHIYPKNIEYNQQILESIRAIHPEYIVISDYNKWVINDELLQNIKVFAHEHDIKILADIKPLNAKHFAGAYLLKPNFKEFCEIVGQQIENTPEDIIRYGSVLVQEMWSNLVVTRGSKWAILMRTDGTSLSIPTQAQQVFDVTWAWDTFISTIAWALASEYSLDDAIILGNKASGIVVGKVWTAIITLQELGL